tara:strand:- start:575 stop:1654 length:1080 start_codon:yes stop_codon:yes gene_type:complete
MKWIGQHIWDFISRFRNKIIQEYTYDGDGSFSDNATDISVTQEGTQLRWGSVINLYYKLAGSLASGVNIMRGLRIDMDDTGNHGARQSKMYGIEIDIDGNQLGSNTSNQSVGMIINNNGSHICQGIEITVGGAGGDAHDSMGIRQNITNGSFELLHESSANPADWFGTITTTNGATTLRTKDADAALAHMTLDIDGDIIFTSNSINTGPETYKPAPTGAWNENFIKVMPNEFIVGDRATDPLVIEDDEDSGAEFGVRTVNALDVMYAFVKIPRDMKATSVTVYASSSVVNGVTAYPYNFQNGENDAVSSTTGNVGAQVVLSPNIGASGIAGLLQDLVIKVAPGSNSIYVHGAMVQITSI